MIMSGAYGMEGVCLRLFNVYGPGQALSNPYTGVLAIFGSRLLNDRPPMVYEDGNQRRDFVHVRDVAMACRLALEVDAAVGGTFNIGSGHAMTIAEVADRMGRVLGRELPPQITRQYRVGDIRHCTADIGLARRVLGYQPQVEFEAGLTELARWLATQSSVDRVDAMRAELSQRGLAL